MAETVRIAHSWRAFVDVIGIEDHRAVGLGQVNWDRVARCVPANVLRMCEFQNDNSAEQVIGGIKVLVEKGMVASD